MVTCDAINAMIDELWPDANVECVALAQTMLGFKCLWRNIISDRVRPSRVRAVFMRRCCPVVFKQRRARSCRTDGGHPGAVDSLSAAGCWDDDYLRKHSRATGKTLAGRERLRLDHRRESTYGGGSGYLSIALCRPAPDGIGEAMLVRKQRQVGETS